jgi:two-component system, OmpR family, sensor histidine kinase VanS
VDRAPGLSVRLKLTLSYAGFLMLAGALLLAIVWVIVLRYQPAVGISPAGPLVRSDLLRSVAIWVAALLVSCWCSVCWEAGFSPAACSPP